MTKYAPLFLIILLFGCAGDADLLADAVYVQKIVEVEIREPEGDENPYPGEVSMPNPSKIVEELIAHDQELASFFCNGNNDDFSSVEQGSYLMTETSDSNFNRLTMNELQFHSKDSYGPSVFRNYVLKEVLKSDFTSDFGNKLIDDITVLRQSGHKVIIRFSYESKIKLDLLGKSARQSHEKVLERHVLSNISKFSSILKENSDVVSCMQVGFVED